MIGFTAKEKATIKMYGKRATIIGRLACPVIGVFAFFAPGLATYLIVKIIRENPEHFVSD
jgi:phage shock protein PspC (stress-responsive transcriptional regulator)